MKIKMKERKKERILVKEKPAIWAKEQKNISKLKKKRLKERTSMKERKKKERKYIDERKRNKRENERKNSVRE